MSTFIGAPYPQISVTVELPSAKFDNARAPESSVIVKRSMLGRLITYVTSSENETLSLTVEMSRLKKAEMENFVKIFQRAEWLLILHDGSRWRVKLLGQTQWTGISGRGPAAVGGEYVRSVFTFTGRKA